MYKTICEDKFLTGAMYAPFCRTLSVSMDQWEGDLKNMAEAGYNCVHGFAEWHDVEYEKGKYDFSKIDYLLECADKYGIKVMVNVATQNCVGFYSPRWLMEEYRGKGTGVIDSRGTTMLQGQFVIPCIDDPFYLVYSNRYLTEVARHFAGDQRVAGYVLWGEPLLTRFDEGSKGICYCEHTLKRFRSWLENKYKDIAALNEVWGSEGPADFADFASVYPPTGSARQLGGFESWSDWRSFMEYNLASHIKDADTLFKENGAMQPTITEMLTGIHNSLDSWELAKTTDIIGISCFDDPGKMSALYMNMSDSMSKALEKSTFVVEALGGHIRYNLMQRPRSTSAALMKSTILQRASYSTRGLMFWCWRPRISDTEGNDFGMVKTNGKVLQRTIDTGKLASIMEKEAGIYNSSIRKSEVAIFMDQSINHLIDSEFMTDSYLHAVTGCHHMLLDMHINSDFINGEYIRKGLLSRYKVLMLPCSYIISEEVAGEIEKFVRNGGIVIADYNLADKRPGGRCYEERPGGGLQKVFGIDVDDILVVKHPVELEENSFGVDIDIVTEFITTIGAKVKDFFKGRPMLTENVYDKGKGIYISTQFFAGYYRKPERKMRQRLLSILEDCGITPHITAQKCDAENVINLLTTARYDIETSKPSVLTFVNSGYETIEDKIFIPAGKYRILNDNGACEIVTEDNATILNLKLFTHESIALIADL